MSRTTGSLSITAKVEIPVVIILQNHDHCTLELRSNRTEQDEQSFLEDLASINYDNGYGGQELFGTIVFKDGTWLERGEYDGSEWWEHRKLPTEKSLFGE